MRDKTLDRVLSISQAGSLACELLALANQHRDLPEFLAQALPRVAAGLEARFVDLAVFSDGRCDTLGDVGASEPLPTDLISDALDREQCVTRGDWSVSPLVHRSSTGEVLAVKDSGQPGMVDAVAGALGLAVEAVRWRHGQTRRSDRLEALLEITHAWGETHETQPLLEQMAEAAGRLLQADRASIFLWDRAAKTLVGRPALGVEGGELRIADDAGIVGQVVQTGESRRVDVQDQREVDRTVDEQTGYETNTLLCVPLISGGKNQKLLGAFEVINKLEGKNFTRQDEADLIELATHAATAIENTQALEQLLSRHQQIVDEAAGQVQLVGDSPALEALRSTIRRVADTDLAILILGENGTGKEVVAQSAHYLSRRRDQPFVAVNCAALSESLLESELFGHEKGAFTDAHEARAGKFEQASGGTLFLDEIGDLSLGGQAKLLRVLEEKVIVRVGGSKTIHTDTRVFAATNQNLAEMVAARTFREDLYYRLNVVTLELPPLRERGADIEQLAEHFLSHFCRQAGRLAPRFSVAAKKRLLHHSWPGNVRELRNLMERLAYLSSGDQIEPEDVAFILSPGQKGAGMVDPGLELTEATRRFQADYITTAIERSAGNMSMAAEQLGLHRSNLYRKMRQLGMSSPSDGEETS